MQLSPLSSPPRPAIHPVIHPLSRVSWLPLRNSLILVGQTGYTASVLPRLRPRPRSTLLPCGASQGQGRGQGRGPRSQSVPRWRWRSAHMAFSLSILYTRALAPIMETANRVPRREKLPILGLPRSLPRLVRPPVLPLRYPAWCCPHPGYDIARPGPC